MKFTLRIFAVSAIFSLLSLSAANAQTIYFCEDVDSDGYPINDASIFTIPDDGGFLYVLVRLPYEIECNSVTLEIERNGNYDNTVYVDVENSWVWFYKQITFYKSGTYEFFIYDCYDDMLVKGEVDIEFN